MDQIKSIASRDNARLVHVRKVRDGKVGDEVYIEGLRLAEELLRTDLRISTGVVTSDFLKDVRGREITEQLLQRKVQVCRVPDPVFRSVADTVHPQGIVLLADRPETGKHRIARALSSAEPGLLLFLYRINNPSNVGAIFRTAEAAGVSGIILSEGSAKVFSPKSIRAAMGANLRIAVWEGAFLEEAVDLARGHGMRIFAADVSGQRPYTDLDLREPAMTVFGSEAHGLPPEALANADEVFVIPMKNNVESLNLAVSCGVVLFESARQRSLPDRRH